MAQPAINGSKNSLDDSQAAIQCVPNFRRRPSSCPRSSGLDFLGSWTTSVKSKGWVTEQPPGRPTLTGPFPYRSTPAAKSRDSIGLGTCAPRSTFSVGCGEKVGKGLEIWRTTQVECNVVKLSAVSSPFGCWNIIKRRQEQMSPSNSCLLDGVCTSRRIPQQKQFLGTPLHSVCNIDFCRDPRSTLLISRTKAPMATSTAIHL